MREHMPGLAPEPVIALMRIAAERPRDARALVGVRRQARQALRPFERTPARSAWWRYMRARVGAQWPFRILTRSASRRAVKRKSPQAGGLLVAIVGSDGAGKSTAVSHVVDWLAWRLNVSVAYLGSSQPSRGTAATKRAAKLARAAARRLGRGAADGATGGLAGTLMALRHHGDALDRARRARKARGLASRGVLVLLDRYPLPNVTVRGRALDGPRIRDTLDASHGLIARLAAREERLYRELPRPDHLIVLRVSPAVATSRRPEHAADDLAARAEAMAALDAGDLPVTVIDADRPLDEVLAAVRATPRLQESHTWDDPSLRAIAGPYSAAINHYVRAELGYASDLPYEVLTGRVQPWSYRTFEGAPVDVTQDLERLLVDLPELRVHVDYGDHDGATPHYAAEYVWAHMNLSAQSQAPLHAPLPRGRAHDVPEAAVPLRPAGGARRTGRSHGPGFRVRAGRRVGAG